MDGDEFVREIHVSFVFTDHRARQRILRKRWGHRSGSLAQAFVSLLPVVCLARFITVGEGLAFGAYREVSLVLELITPATPSIGTRKTVHGRV
jgi:hypothetical protein